MNRIIKILMERDGVSEKEAKELIAETREACLEEMSDEPIMDILGLEPDYIVDIF